MQWIKRGTVVMLLLWGIISHAQEYHLVNRDSVKMAISDPTKPTYYPKLLKRLKEYDSTLTDNDYRQLYYGFVFDTIYSAYEDTRKSEIYQLIDNKNYEEALKLCDTLLQTMPVSLTVHYMKAFALYCMLPGKKSDYDKCMRINYGFRNAVLSSGDGKSYETAFKTIFVPDEYTLLVYFELTASAQALIGDRDMLTVKKSKRFKQKKIFFDTSETLAQLSKEFEDAEKKKKK